MEKLSQFMRGRYGIDQLGRSTQFVMLLFLVLSIITRYQIFTILMVLCLVMIYYRMFSKNIAKRNLENVKYLKATEPIRKKINLMKRKWKDRNIYRYVKCSECGKLLRVPKGKGKIKVKCGHCNHTFTMKS